MRVFMGYSLSEGGYSPPEALASPPVRELSIPLRSPSASESNASIGSAVATGSFAEPVEGAASLGAGVASAVVGAGVGAGVAAAWACPAGVQLAGALAAPPSCLAQPMTATATSKAMAVSLVMGLTGRFTGWVSLSRSIW
jgi:hypothetical protein